MQQLQIKLANLKESKGWFHPTQDDCWEWYNALNEEIFHGALNSRRPTFEMKRLRNLFAEFDYENCVYLINIRYRTKSKFVEILAHEMVHHYQLVNQLSVKHGPSFYKWKKPFADFGLELRRIPKGSK